MNRFARKRNQTFAIACLSSACGDRLHPERVIAPDALARSLLNSKFSRAGELHVVRLQKDVLVEIEGEKKLLRSLTPVQGEARDFGWVKLRVDGKVKVRLIGVWSKNSREIWWLATNLKQELAEIVGLYDRRMSIEKQFRDTKGARFGLKLKWTAFEKGEYLERLYLLIGVAALLWTSVGRFVEKTQPKVRMRCRRKGARLSLIRVGTLFWGKAAHRLKITTKFVRQNLPLPKVRIFPWLQDFQK